MARNNARVEGLAEFIQFAEQLEREVENEAKEVIKEATLKTERDAKLLAPVDTGYMRNSIQSTFEEGGLKGIVTANAEYSIFLEFGTSRQPAQPFLFPSFNSNLQKFLSNFSKIIDKAGGS